MKYFGTDGIRATFNNSFLNQNFAISLGEALAEFIKFKNLEGKKVLIGKDTRPSSNILLRSFSTGLRNKGYIPSSTETVPTPALALGTLENDFVMGVMITASHNPYEDNGFKFFNSDGSKLNDNDERLIEDFLKIQKYPNALYDPVIENVEELYLQHILDFFPENMLKRKKIVVDLSNGATSRTTPKMLHSLGAEVIAINTGDGKINDSVGSEFPKTLAKKVCITKADFGIAHDGDGDRVIFSDSSGNIIHGDKILGLLAIHEKKEKRLKNDSMVVTVHSNSGLDASLKDKNILVHRSGVGDRRVAELMKDKKACLGGESSGHILATDILPTGDGLLTALLVARASIESNKSIFKLAEDILLWPSKEGSFRVKEKIPLESCDLLNNKLIESRNFLKLNGRILIRYSGTEQKVRLLVEAVDSSVANKIFCEIANIIVKTL